MIGGAGAPSSCIEWRRCRRCGAALCSAAPVGRGAGGAGAGACASKPAPRRGLAALGGEGKKEPSGETSSEEPSSRPEAIGGNGRTPAWRFKSLPFCAGFRSNHSSYLPNE